MALDSFSQWMINWSESLPEETLRTCIWFSTSSFPASVVLKAYMDLGSPLCWVLYNCGKELSTIPHWTCREWKSILFLTFWFFGVVSTTYPILPCLTESNCMILADVEDLSFFQSLGSCNVSHGTCHLIWNILTLQRKKLYAFIYFMDNTLSSLTVLRLDGSLHGIFLISGIL